MIAPLLPHRVNANGHIAFCTILEIGEVWQPEFDLVDNTAK